MPFPNQPHQTNVLWNRGILADITTQSKFQEFKHKLKIFKICCCHTFIHEVKNNEKLNTCQFLFHYMTKNKLLKDSF